MEAKLLLQSKVSQNKVRQRKALAGWVSLPILAMILMVATLSTEYQNRMLAAYKWQGQLQDVEADQAAWESFQSAFVFSPSFHLAQQSDCLGFCPLNANQNTEGESQWHHAQQTFYYQWHAYDPALVEGNGEEGNETDSEVSSEEKKAYRLCGSQNQLSYLCWWWQEEKLISNAWVTINT
ncbi:hypothetical protein OFY17_10320 [Marinomonas sp. C2222]|uniref:Uncharacterized protein n=1 Tax=Marinomonas sargassi TaxID=2984494 RepID=A0ABT2YUI9_9GAMM|nr:hypothetical protein [Marinomonas sargassi]MCV2403274.1 hypothetical protein [Marinomonas sargassi]